MDIPTNIGISESIIRRVSTALSLGVEPKDIEVELQKDGISERDIYLSLIAGDVHNRMMEKDYPLSSSDL